jgi:hypothetical protein
MVANYTDILEEPEKEEEQGQIIPMIHVRQEGGFDNAESAVRPEAIDNYEGCPELTRMDEFTHTRRGI